MLSVRVAAALARTLPRRAAFVSSSNLVVYGFCRHVAPIYDVARMIGEAVLQFLAHVFGPEDTGPFTG